MCGFPHIPSAVSYSATRDVKPRGLASASRPKNLASWVLASASTSWVLVSTSASLVLGLDQRGRGQDSWARPREVRLQASRPLEAELSTGRMVPRVGSGRVGSGRVGSGRVGSGRVGSGHDFAGFWRVGSALRII